MSRSGTRVDPVVLAADRALEIGDDRELLPIVPTERRADLHRRFEDALGRMGFDDDDVPAARAFVAAYVRYFKFAEGEDHDGHAPDGHGAAVGSGHHGDHAA